MIQEDRQHHEALEWTQDFSRGKKSNTQTAQGAMKIPITYFVVCLLLFLLLLKTLLEVLRELYYGERNVPIDVIIEIFGAKYFTSRTKSFSFCIHHIGASLIGDQHDT